MGRQGPGTWTPGWVPPDYSVGDDGKINGYVNERKPNNWGRWGADDQVGTVNLITPEVIASAATLISEGRAVSCAIPLDSSGPVHPTRAGVSHWYGYTGSDFIAGSSMNRVYPGVQATDDYLTMPLQGSTQWDGLAHIAYDDAMYNGFWLGNVEQLAGATKLSIHQMSGRLCGRGVLLDVAKYKGLDRLEPGYAITVDDLDRTATSQGVEVRSGDILIIRTGHIPWYYTLENKLEFFSAGAPGLSIHTVDWIHDKDIAALAVDNIAVEVEPHEEPYEHVMPVHARLIRDLGLTLGEIWHLEELSEVCAELDRYEFFLAATPLNVTNASGSPVNPVALF